MGKYHPVNLLYFVSSRTQKNKMPSQTEFLMDIKNRENNIPIPEEYRRLYWDASLDLRLDAVREFIMLSCVAVPVIFLLGYFVSVTSGIFCTGIVAVILMVVSICHDRKERAVQKHLLLAHIKNEDEEAASMIREHYHILNFDSRATVYDHLVTRRTVVLNSILGLIAYSLALVAIGVVWYMSL